jgi:hypothetical protein
MSNLRIESVSRKTFDNSLTEARLLKGRVTCWECKEHFLIKEFPETGCYCYACKYPRCWKKQIVEDEGSTIYTRIAPLPMESSKKMAGIYQY